MNKLFFLLSLLILFCARAHGQILENYDGLWKSAREESWLGSNNQVELEVNLATFPESELKIKLPSRSTVFIDGKLWQLTTRDTVFSKRLSEFQGEFGQDTVTFTVVSSNLGLGKTSIKKVLRGVNVVDNAVVVEGETFKGRFVPQPVKDFYFTAMLVIFFLLTLYKLAYPYLLGMMLQPLSVINAEDFSDSGNLQKFFSFDIIFYILIVAMMISQGAVTGLVVFQREWLETWIGLDYSSLVAIWLGGAFLVLVLTIVKFMGIKFISYLFDLGKAEFSHFFYLLRLIVFGSAVVLLVGAFFAANNFSGLQSAFSLLFRGFFWFYIVGVFGLFLIMMNRLSFKKYHLFTYLCIAELVPFLILAKWIMGLGQ